LIDSLIELCRAELANVGACSEKNCGVNPQDQNESPNGRDTL